MSTNETFVGELLAVDSGPLELAQSTIDGIGESIAKAMRVEITHEPLTYREDVRESFYRDLLLRDRPGAQKRLDRHAEEMRALTEVREKAARRKFEDGGFESRAEPNRTAGQGGNFAPPAWLNELFATGKHAERVLASLIPARFPLPAGVSSVNVPIIGGGGTLVAPAIDNAAAPTRAITDSAGTSTVATLTGQVDVALQLLEQSPVAASIDWVIFKDMMESYGADLEAQLLAGAGSTFDQLVGILNVTGIVNAVYTGASPTGSAMYPFFGEAVGQLADGRELPPEIWLMRTSRWGWLSTQESTAGLPFSILSPFFMGNDPATPDPIGGLLGWPVFLDESIPATLGAGANQDTIISLRPSDLILFEGDVQTATFLEPLSGNLGARIQMHNRAAALTNRFPSSIATVSGTGMVVQANY